MMLFEQEKFLYLLKVQLRQSKLMPYIGQLDKFVYLKQEFVVVNLQQISLSYCEKFVDKNPNQYFDAFVKFCYPAMGMVYKKTVYEFIFSYQNAQVIRHISLVKYRDELVKRLGYHFEDYSFFLSEQAISYAIKPNRQHSAVKRFEHRINDFVYKFNQQNQHLVPVATYFIEKGSQGSEKLVFTVNFMS